MTFINLVNNTGWFWRLNVTVSCLFFIYREDSWFQKARTVQRIFDIELDYTKAKAINNENTFTRIYTVPNLKRLVHEPKNKGPFLLQKHMMLAYMPRGHGLYDA
jgi:hypothetical protein